VSLASWALGTHGVRPGLEAVVWQTQKKNCGRAHVVSHRQYLAGGFGDRQPCCRFADRLSSTDGEPRLLRHLFRRPLTRPAAIVTAPPNTGDSTQPRRASNKDPLETRDRPSRTIADCAAVARGWTSLSTTLFRGKKRFFSPGQDPPGRSVLPRPNSRRNHRSGKGWPLPLPATDARPKP